SRSQECGGGYSEPSIHAAAVPVISTGTEPGCRNRLSDATEQPLATRRRLRGDGRCAARLRRLQPYV
ncbi:MAG: hypothetical protein ACK55I_33105, partial [bacterium]